MKFEKYVHDSMQELTQNIQPDEKLHARVMNAVQVNRAKTRPNRLRLTLVAAATLCIFAGGALAAGPIVGLVSSGSPNGDTQTLSDEAKIEKKVGFAVRLPQTMGKATFQNMSATPVDAIDADGNTVLSYQEFFASYQDGNTMPSLSVIEAKNVTDQGTLSDKTIVETREINGISVTYRVIPTIFLPPDNSIQPTQEEIAAEQRGECFISYGTESRIDGVFHTIDWEQDGLVYTINANDGEWTTNDFFTAAQDVISTPQ